jgi:hypothetical protein
MPQIDLERLTKNEVSSLSGHPRGLAARDLFDLDKLDHSLEPVIVTAPASLVAITPSFIQGMFARSVHQLGEDRFYKQYNFNFPSHLMTDVRLGIQRSMMRRDLAGAA